MAERADGQEGPCTKQFFLRELVEGQNDKLGHEVDEILWIGRQYAIYRTRKGVYVQFSDSEDEERAQRSKFTRISPELCELRYLTCELHARWRSSPSLLRLGSSDDPAKLYDYSIAQSIALVMENDIPGGMTLAKQTLALVVDRVTNDNTVRYFVSCVICWMLCAVLGVVALWVVTRLYPWPELRSFVVAAMFGATGAMLSVAIRLREFALRPCQQSNMNIVRSATRVGIGFIAGPLLLLLPHSAILSDHWKLLVSGGLQGAAVLGVLGGFTERLLPNLLQKAVGQSEPAAGTPVQAARMEQARAQAAVG